MPKYRIDQALQDGRQAATHIRRHGGSPLAAAYAQIEAAFSPSACHARFKERVAALMRSGPTDPEVRMRYRILAERHRAAGLVDAIALVEGLRGWRNHGACRYGTQLGRQWPPPPCLDDPRRTSPDLAGGAPVHAGVLRRHLGRGARGRICRARIGQGRRQARRGRLIRRGAQAAKAALALPTMASNAAGSRIARSESTLRSTMTPALARPSMNLL